ncbi:protein-glutamine glutaminase family protein [Vogesella sp. LIG4]|uniref:protein-glutamine glutaminase family protein n=1 Tax=Vogesella sp. LIG4 TaxID=1192162 RepID=UPI00081FCF26|nr:protein-glutamine glutaminase family protein [Vogesella sp. LIG4]SCK28202.1 hypothetical protein PSELUDRAFT_3444 [Vogesella sp. LIG4]
MKKQSMKLCLALLAALLSGSALAENLCANVAGLYGGSFFAAPQDAASGKDKVVGRWSVDIKPDCMLSAYIDAAPYGSTDYAYGRYVPANAQEDRLDPSHLALQFAHDQIFLKMGALGEKDGRGIHGTLAKNKYIGDFSVDSVEKSSTSSWKFPGANKEVQVGAVSETMANMLFQRIVDRGDIPFGWTYGESQYRAEKMALVLDDLGVFAAKDFVEGKIYLDPAQKLGDSRERSGKSRVAGFRYYVGITLLVKKGNELVPYVLDPSLFTTPVPQTVWKAKLLAKSKSVLEHEYFTDRFVMFLEDKDEGLKDFKDSDLEEMDQQIRNDARALYVYSQ